MQNHINTFIERNIKPRHARICYRQHALFSFFRKNGITEPFEPITLPYLTTENFIGFAPRILFAAINNLSEASFVAPYRFIGAAALSVESATTF